ncbi:hypothetical protein FKP32DRAFT_355958 [Trametes sanguinea]|nr:hypothetical protein FKP32DRAFT_355958 [Trametes sanguinea]
MIVVTSEMRGRVRQTGIRGHWDYARHVCTVRGAGTPLEKHRAQGVACHMQPPKAVSKCLTSGLKHVHAIPGLILVLVPIVSRLLRRGHSFQDPAEEAIFTRLYASSSDELERNSTTRSEIGNPAGCSNALFVVAIATRRRLSQLSTPAGVG